MTLGPVVASSRLSEHEVVRSEDLSEWSGSDRVHGARLKVHQHSSGHVLATAGLVVVDVDSLQLQLRLANIGASGVNTMLIRDYLPKLQTLSIIDKEIYLKLILS